MENICHYDNKLMLTVASERVKSKATPAWTGILYFNWFVCVCDDYLGAALNESEKINCRIVLNNCWFLFGVIELKCCSRVSKAKSRWLFSLFCMGFGWKKFLIVSVLLNAWRFSTVGFLICNIVCWLVYRVVSILDVTECVLSGIW